ncbi:PTS sugar transporter subunit IIA [Maridesulfovibrio salexigens]|uniref:Putative PTS IIA-like nitrogen-regulatory protein PtsN n=1 Tax=Maridesulfovibrio salexigens (strain ATCC 14822 / DSM 2638 / NCIMB 8403 / VKM B-1763) TaxID=526222 RepID=C6BWM9_MARSD|nr:PTS sugar transporter subunit IIA [Maridesulfovibrio salexigens]ACS80309.1 putative PTS IIA-like nitrogen-regulatory protein PtsN [Maridesulfovibrio salexigens DSM 2638]
MNITDNLAKDLVIHELQASDKSEVLKELVSTLKDAGLEVDVENALKVLNDREKLGTTGIGDGIAIPHGKLECLEEIVVVVGRSSEGVDFESLDMQPCKIFFMVLAPEQGAGAHLKVLAQISRQLKDEAFRQAFIDTGDKQELLKLLGLN